MPKRRSGPPRPPRPRLPATVGPRPRHTTAGRQPRAAAKRHQAARIIDPDDSSLLDVIDNLLSKGVVLNAELILALADVDLVYLRISALMCAADRILPRRSR